MEFQTGIDPIILASALTDRIEEDNMSRRGAGFIAKAGKDNLVSVTVREGMCPQNNLVADVTWEGRDGGSHVSVTYRKPAEGEVTPKGLLAPLAAYITMMILVGSVMWGAGFGLLHLMLDGRAALIPWLACLAPAAYLIAIVISTSTARLRARLRFERLLRDMFDETIRKVK